MAYPLFSTNSTHMSGALCPAVRRQTYVHLDAWKILTFLGMTNTEPNLLSLGQALHYTQLVICQIFIKCCICVAALKDSLKAKKHRKTQMKSPLYSQSQQLILVYIFRFLCTTKAWSFYVGPRMYRRS